jgi:predicted RNase H-like nuclease
MINRTNQVVELADGREYGIMKHIAYQGRTFFIASELTDNKQDLKDEIVILEQVVYEGKDCIVEVDDPEIIKLITTNVKSEDNE